MTAHNECPDCKGSGKYVGFTKIEECAACGGSGVAGGLPSYFIAVVKNEDPSAPKNCYLPLQRFNLEVNFSDMNIIFEPGNDKPIINANTKEPFFVLFKDTISLSKVLSCFGNLPTYFIFRCSATKTVEIGFEKSLSMLWLDENKVGGVQFWSSWDVKLLEEVKI